MSPELRELLVPGTPGTLHSLVLCPRNSPKDRGNRPAPTSGTTSASDSACPKTFFSYDLDGNLLSTTDPDGHTSWTVYDALNRPVKTVSADGNGPNDTHFATTTVYDAVGNVISVTDPDGNTTSWVYDNLNRAIETIDPLYNLSFADYDADGNVVQTTDADGRVIQFRFDSLNRQVEEYWLDADGNVYHTIQTWYDADSEVVGVTETDTTTSLHVGNPCGMHELRVQLRCRRRSAHQPHGPRRPAANADDCPSVRARPAGHPELQL